MNMNAQNSFSLCVHSVYTQQYRTDMIKLYCEKKKKKKDEYNEMSTNLSITQNVHMHIITHFLCIVGFCSRYRVARRSIVAVAVLFVYFIIAAYFGSLHCCAATHRWRADSYLYQAIENVP